MGLRERVSEGLDFSQKIVFAAFFGIALFGNIALQIWLTTAYEFHTTHLILFIGIVLVVFNPEGIRPILFLFFIYHLIKLFKPHYGEYIGAFDLDKLLLAFPLYLTNIHYETVAYFHIALYALLAYFALNNPLRSKNERVEEVLDQLD